MGQWGEAQLNDLLGALADLTLNTQTNISHAGSIAGSPPLKAASLAYLDLWGEGGQVEGEH